jgi:hypothetical protein
VELIKLNFPDYKFTLKGQDSGGKSLKIFDIIRKKYVNLSPEEWVRQHLIHYLIRDKAYPESLTAVEKMVMVNRLQRRFDLLIYSRDHHPLLLAECKSPRVPVSQEVFDQAARYNLGIGARYFVLSNGLQTYCCRVLDKEGTYEFLEDVPYYEKK